MYFLSIDIKIIFILAYPFPPNPPPPKKIKKINNFVAPTIRKLDSFTI